MDVEGSGEGGAAVGADFVEWLGPDCSAIVIALLGDTDDLARAAAVSRSWRTLVMSVHFSRIECLRVCPEAISFTRIEHGTSSVDGSVNGTDGGDAGSTAAAAIWESHQRDQNAYKRLVHDILYPYARRGCIAGCVGASSTDNFPHESIANTLLPGDRVLMMPFIEPSYWSSGGHVDTGVPECLVYKLSSDLCLIDEIRIQPFQAFFQTRDPIYSAQYVRFRMGCPKSPLLPEHLVSDEHEGQSTTDDNYIWNYTSPEFPMLQENDLQSFKLPRPVLCIGGVVKIELLGRIQTQMTDGLYYICMAHVQILGIPLSKELGAAYCENGLVLKYYPDPGRSDVCCSEPSGNGSHCQSEWHNVEGKLWQPVTGRGVALNMELLGRLFSPPSQLVGEEDDEAEERTRSLA